MEIGWMLVREDMFTFFKSIGLFGLDFVMYMRNKFIVFVCNYNNVLFYIMLFKIWLCNIW